MKVFSKKTHFEDLLPTSSNCYSCSTRKQVTDIVCVAVQVFVGILTSLLTFQDAFLEPFFEAVAVDSGWDDAVYGTVGFVVEVDDSLPVG